MAKHSIKVASVAPKLNKDSAVVVALTEKNSKLAVAENLIALGLTAEHDLGKLGAKNSSDSTTRVPGPNGSVIVLLGGFESGNLDAIRHAGGTIGRN
ncbi:MAG: hypothetical protein RL319_1032, partial [Actinomycetota bacterium]